ncbi:MAG TPA: glycine betaine ABC transporter substrate-binding protein [Segeticoccus sp.]|uniref:glycine betaine ABC transporter substrate-binding protein n=1 Tax=Segeticoccus sp. TaxID=2706531 RepID=UPI002D7EEA9B|nr:glycine betaine ABC transporter substrate-binding protein [Segeticoccus sp.]HET8601294.1 glycine betaine ABC transporter substrate-binding protein [Segeticoccus sp.]
MHTARTYKTVAAGSAAVVAAALIAGCGASKTASGSNTAGSSGGSTAASTGGSGGGGGGSSKTITIPTASGWDEDVAVSYLWKYVLEQKGYTVKLPSLDIGVIFNGISQGTGSNADLFFDTWLPKTHAPYWKKIHNKVEDLDVWYDQATLNIAVPTYLKDINSIADLKGKASEFDGKITGIDPGAGLTRVTKEAIKTYGLNDYTLQTSSTAAMLAALKSATDAKKPIVVTLWHPHWAYSAFPIKDLKDPKHAMGGAEKIHAIARQGFSQDYPKVAKAVKSFKMDDKTLASLELQVVQKHKDNPDEGIQAWIKTSQGKQAVNQIENAMK